MDTVSFNIKKWHYLYKDKENILQHYSNDKNVTLPVCKIPAGMKRRMSTISKMAVQVAMDASYDEMVDFIIFTSQHGEINRTIDILTTIAKQEPISPTAFSQSVHNTASGHYTIATKNALPVTSICAGSESIRSGLIEAFAYLHGKPNATVLLVDFDEPCPDMLNKGEQMAPSHHALAMLLKAGDEHQLIFNEIGAQTVTLGSQFFLQAQKGTTNKFNI
ncbi:beta-ketoacyl synthase chain length factor [Thaumasiovibrio subtropicus]|uniref:beta-ketoacyl synthase chain length factor n=1 Tax=Thaumasiovibrio subtropicus TaxID=1891207 RepID=UPI000B35D256|nr:beta-ketoacyl synthase chain length factor [Thaumasiovibrio subtropicus]